MAVLVLLPAYHLLAYPGYWSRALFAHSLSFSFIIGFHRFM
jgi:hypothetical protein